MSNIAISVENLSKKYVIGELESYYTMRDLLSHILNYPLRLLNKKEIKEKEKEIIWALKDVSFEVQHGDIVGIIGRNGAGKSTLLKILSRITPPTEGVVKLNGRVGSLLEVGTGFHPELTGRENIFLNGSILGMSKKEIERKFDEIVDFAEIEIFLDTPVKRYSSGMYVRLAFAVAAHMEPEILVVDEVLSVGDASFQKKCLGKMGDVSKEGRTVLFVSHNMSSIQRLCKNGIFLDNGEIRKFGSIEKVLFEYLNSLNVINSFKNKSNKSIQKASFTDWRLIGDSIITENSCYSRDNCIFKITLSSSIDINDCFIGFALWNTDGQLILAVNSNDINNEFNNIYKGVNNFLLETRLPIKEGNYNLDISLNSRDLGQIDRWQSQKNLIILPKNESNLPTYWHGLLNEKVKFTVIQ